MKKKNFRKLALLKSSVAKLNKQNSVKGGNSRTCTTLDVPCEPTDPTADISVCFCVTQIGCKTVTCPVSEVPTCIC
ncbi:hypothetical protein [Ascidiimonas aurantiaca]|uniref:hypothetical protein n=1 Tax=Ascidiimonas aurantiaca TaxID=1685432 RepID=UPI0030ED1360